METAKVVISVRPDRREGALVAYGLRARKKLHGVRREPRHLLPGRATGGLRGEDLHFDCNMATISGRLGKGREPGVEAKFC
jgi:hypothetical protein